MKTDEKRPVDVYFETYAANHQNPTNKMLQLVYVPLIFFGVMGLIWAIPFPELEFLKSKKTFVNWFSFFMAAIVLYYYLLSPTLAFLMILVISLLAYFVVCLEKWEAAGGATLWQVSLLILIAGCIGQVIGNRLEGKKNPLSKELRFSLIGPIWLLHIVGKKIGLKH